MESLMMNLLSIDVNKAYDKRILAYAFALGVKTRDLLAAEPPKWLESCWVGHLQLFMSAYGLFVGTQDGKDPVKVVTLAEASKQTDKPMFFSVSPYLSDANVFVTFHGFTYDGPLNEMVLKAMQDGAASTDQVLNKRILELDPVTALGLEESNNETIGGEQ